MGEPVKCAHPSCDCMMLTKGDYGKYCSEHCKEAGQITELRCNCQHPACRQPQHAAANPAHRVSA